MITKIKANKSFRGTTKYVLEKEKAKIIGGNMYGTTTNELVEQFALSAHLNPQLKDPCYHLMLSVPKSDRTLSDDEMAKISERHFATVVVLSRLKGEEAQVKQQDKRIPSAKLNQLVDQFIVEELPAYDFFVARHGDKKHDHTHIVASRVNNLDSKSIRTWNNYAHSEHSARLLEREFNLTQVQSSWESKHKAMTRNQLDRVQRDGLPGEEIMRRAIDAATADRPTMPELINQLWSEHRIRAEVSYYSHGGVRGIKYGIDVGQINSDGTPRLLWKQGHNLNKYKYSFNFLQSELGISYNPGRDDQQILALTEMMHLAPIRQDLQQEAPTPLRQPTSTPPPTETEFVAEQKRPHSLSQWTEMYVAYSRGLENLLSLDRDKEIALRAFKQGASDDEVEKIIATSPVGWTQDEAKLIASVVLSQLEQELEQTQKRSPENLPQITDSQLVAAERRIALYFQAAPTNPTDQQLAQATERHQEKLATAATANQEYRRSEQELESASIVDKLLPGYREKRKEAAKLAARFIGATEALERTQSELNQLEQQRRTFEQWQSSPQTQEMERRQDYLNTQDAKTRLREIKEQQRELERQQKPSREQGPGLSL